MVITRFIYCVIIFIGCAFNIGTCIAQNGLIINEVLAKGEQSIVDQDGDISDWIELYNDSKGVIDLEGYSLVDEGGEWYFPSVKIPAASFLVVFASKKNRYDIDELHTNFKLDRGGELIALRDKDKFTIDKISFPELEVDESYGRINPSQNDWKKYKPATPMTINEGAISIPFGQIISSHKDGFYNEPISITLSNFDTANTIYYTLDGSMPDETSMVYTLGSTIKIGGAFIDETIAYIPTSDEWETPAGNVPTLQILRAVAYRAGLQKGDVYTQNFWVGSDDFSQQLPIISIIGKEADFFDEEKGIFVKGINENYWQKGRSWERPISVSFFDKNGELLLHQDAGIRLGGAKTRREPQKTLRLYARGDYGKKTFKFPFWGDVYGDDIKRITLRTLNVGPWSKAGIMDDLIHEIINEEINVDYVRRNFAAVYINGVYWGVHSMREHNNQHFIERKYGVDEDEVVIAKATASIPEVYNKFDTLVAEIASLDLKNQSDYDYVAANLDIEQYTNYIITNLAFANRDWPANNTEYWYSNAYDGRIRFIINDLDATMLVHNDERLELYITEQAERLERDKWGRVLIFMQKLLENRAYRIYFNQRITDLLNTTFAPDRTIAILNDIVATVKPEIQTHIDRWHFPNKIEKWENAVERLQQFLIRRPNFLLNQSNELFGAPLSINPNPVLDNLFIEIDPWQDCKVSLRLSDSTGKEVQNEVFDVLEGLQEVSINTNQLANGIYILDVSYLGFKTAQKIVKVAAK